jgi:hypothetical protein
LYQESDAFAGVSKKKTASIFKVEVSQFVTDQSGSTYLLVAQLSLRNVLHNFRQVVSLMTQLTALMCLRLAGEARTLGGGFWPG